MEKIRNVFLRAKTNLSHLPLSPPHNDPARFRLRNIKGVLKSTWAAMNDPKISLSAAGVAYFSTLSFFPLMVALVSIVAFFMQPQQLHDVVQAVNAYLPKDIASLITSQLNTLIGKQSTTIFATVAALLFALYGIGSSIENLLKSINVAYRVEETRRFQTVKALSFIMTFGMILLIFVIVPVLVVTPAMLTSVQIPATLAATFPVLRWILLVLIVSFALAVLYRFGPNRKKPEWRWLSWGVVVATVLWMAITAIFFMYARYFANFSNSYSLFAGIIALMIWLNFSATALLIGARVNAALEIKR